MPFPVSGAPIRFANQYPVGPDSPFARFINQADASPQGNRVVKSAETPRDIYSRDVGTGFRAPTPDEIRINPAAKAAEAVERQVISETVQGKNPLDPTIH